MDWTIEQRVRDVICEELGIADAPTHASLDRLGADSHDRLSLTLALEDAFGIEIPDRDAQGLKTVADIVAYVERQLPATT